jgi:hypothetical protein
MAKFVVEHPVLTAAAVGAGSAVGTGVNLGIAHLANKLKPDLNEAPPHSILHNVKEHPYMTALSGNIAPLALGPVGSVVNLGTSVLSTAGGKLHAEDIEKGEHSSGLLANFSYRHPHLGSIISRFIPGTYSVNSAIAGHRLANDAESSHNFTERHPNLSAFLHGLVPGLSAPYANAAADLSERQHKAASIPLVKPISSTKKLAAPVQKQNQTQNSHNIWGLVDDIPKLMQFIR